MKYIFITGGVVSGLGKGICAASLGRLLKQRGLRVQNQKFDPYLNVDPGTMSPYQHGEVFVTDDGAETDLDLGHYERFTDESLTAGCSVSAGKVYWSVLCREREGGYLGRTVQIIPHITDEIKSRIYQMDNGKSDVLITEIGGTVGDIESQPFLEAIRQVAAEQGKKNVLFIHVPRESRFGAEDGNLAYENASLMAEALGVSQIYMGFVLTAVRQDRKAKLAAMLGLGDRRICAVMALGMPQFRYPNYIDRAPAPVTRK